jgi:ssDNA-binding Zn-finger/Zn-ribbon topoisomerase 1
MTEKQCAFNHSPIKYTCANVTDKCPLCDLRAKVVNIEVFYCPECDCNHIREAIMGEKFDYMCHQCDTMMVAIDD